MTATRSHKQEKIYSHHLKHIEPPHKGCAFCELSQDSPQVVRLTTYFKIVHNIFPYTLWDSQPVEDHLMLIPNEHTETIADLSDPAALEFMSIVGGYERNGYSFYARAPGSILKSVSHQHTHLIKLKHRKIKGLLYFRRPYIRFLIK